MLALLPACAFISRLLGSQRRQKADRDAVRLEPPPLKTRGQIEGLEGGGGVGGVREPQLIPPHTHFAAAKCVCGREERRL